MVDVFYNTLICERKGVRRTAQTVESRTDLRLDQPAP